jgi:hypothetical protein
MVLVVLGLVTAGITVQATEITDMSWDSNMGIIGIALDECPSTWGNWRIYMDGIEIPMEGRAGNPVVRPNAPLDEPPTGLFVGTEPWVTGLENVDFPCCGTIQFDIPGEGLTNQYKFNFVDLGCETVSKKECPSEWIHHIGDLVISGTETFIIEDAQYFQEGNIYVNDESKLVIRNSKLAMGRGDVPTVHVYLFVDPSAEVEIDNSRIYPESGLVCVFNKGTVTMTDSPTSIHYFDMSDGAQLTMVNSEMVFTIGGLLQVTGGNTILIDSTIGALALKIPADAYMNISGLESGAYFEYWDVHEMIPQADYNLVLERSHILEDDFTGKLEHGPYERGWLFFLDPDAHVRISDSELRKVFIDIINDKVEFENLKVGIPSSLSYRDIELTDVIVMGQWPFTIINSNVTISDSDYLFLQPRGNSIIYLQNSHMVEFIPRDFSGVMVFENGIWTEAGEIIGSVPYHSMYNDFTIKGSLKIEGVRENLQWKDAQVTREFDVLVTDAYNNPIEGVCLKIEGTTYLSDNVGKAKFSLIFNENNYDQPKNLEISVGGSLIAREEIDFFTETPIRILTSPTIIPILDIKANNSDGPIILNRPDTLTVSVALDNNGIIVTADFWLAAYNPFGVFFFTLEGWTTDWVPVYQGPLFYFPPIDLLTIPTSDLPIGSYWFYFAVDTNRDGDITWDSLYWDAVGVNLTE